MYVGTNIEHFEIRGQTPIVFLEEYALATEARSDENISNADVTAVDSELD